MGYTEGRADMYYDIFFSWPGEKQGAEQIAVCRSPEHDCEYNLCSTFVVILVGEEGNVAEVDRIIGMQNAVG